MKIKKLTALFMGAMLLAGCGSGSGKSGDKAKETAAGTSAAETAAVTEEPEPIVPKVIEYDPEKPVIALTFDDGPNTTITPRVLDLLEEYNAAATFFLIGDNINEESAESVRRAYAMGCEIENHSKTHSYMNKMEAEDIVAEVNETNEKIIAITGVEPKFFRPPYFAVNDVMYDNIDMTFISGLGVDDWNSKVTVEKRIDGVMGLAQDGVIILLHDVDGNYQTIEALETIIPKLQEEGYQLVTLEQLFEAKGKSPSDEEFRYKLISLVDEY